MKLRARGGSPVVLDVAVAIGLGRRRHPRVHEAHRQSSTRWRRALDLPHAYSGEESRGGACPSAGVALTAGGTPQPSPFARFCTISPIGFSPAAHRLDGARMRPHARTGEMAHGGAAISSGRRPPSRSTRPPSPLCNGVKSGVGGANEARISLPRRPAPCVGVALIPGGAPPSSRVRFVRRGSRGEESGWGLGFTQAAHSPVLPLGPAAASGPH